MGYLDNLNDPLQYMRQKLAGNYIPSAIAEDPNLPVNAPALPEQSQIPPAVQQGAMKQITPIESTELQNYGRTEPMQADYHPSRFRNIMSKIGGIATGISSQDPKEAHKANLQIRNAPYDKQHQQWEQGFNMRARANDIASANEKAHDESELKRANITRLGTEAESDRGRNTQELATANLANARAIHLNDPDYAATPMPEMGGYIKVNKTTGQMEFVSIPGITRHASEEERAKLIQDHEDTRATKRDETSIKVAGINAASREKSAQINADRATSTSSGARRRSAPLITADRKHALDIVRGRNAEAREFFITNPKNPKEFILNMPKGFFGGVSEKKAATFNRLSDEVEAEFQKLQDGEAPSTTSETKSSTTSVVSKSSTGRKPVSKSADDDSELEIVKKH